MSSFAKSVNPCGRKISYPKFRALNTPGSPPPPNTTLAPAPGTEVEDSVCRPYYEDKSIQNASPECKSCWQSALDSDAECPCNLDAANPCAFARCVDKAFAKSGKCASAHAALFNKDDVNDEQFLPAFALADLKDCPVGTEEGFFWGGDGSKRNMFIVIGLILLIGVPLLMALWQFRQAGGFSRTR